jgi:glycosyltransferase involved in cell wall biosynthesis
MQHGKPVVCSAVGGNPEIIDDGDVGYLYAMGDVDVLSEVLRDLAVNPKLRIKIGSAARLKVGLNYTISSMTTDTEQLYQTLAPVFL